MAKKTKSTGTTPETEKKKKAVIIANAKYDDFRKEYERTKEQYAKHYPGGVEFIETQGYEGLEKAFGQVDKDEDLIMLAHHNADAMFGVPVSDPTFRTFDAPEGKTLATLFSGLQNRGYQGNCYLGICKGEETAKSLQNAGVNIPIFSTPEDKKWFGSNAAAKGTFEDFFFGIGKGKQAKDHLSNTIDPQNPFVPQTIDPEIGEDFKLNLSPVHQELMKRRKSGTPVREVAPLEPIIKSGSKLPVYEGGGVLGKLGGASGIAGMTSSLIEGIQMFGEQRKQGKQAEQFAELSKIVSMAAGLSPDKRTRKYVRPEDMLIDPDQLHPSFGTGTNFLAKNGKKLPSYEGGGLLTDITGAGNEGNVGNMLGSLIGGGEGNMNGAGKIGSTVGGIAGSFLGPLGTAAGSFIGGTIGGVIGGNKQKQIERDQKEALQTLQQSAFQQGSRGLHNQFSSFMEFGGKTPGMEKGGELQLYKGDADVISENPFLPEGGETVMFNGPSHAQGGMPIKFGKNTVEVEGGEPAVKMNDNLVIFGDMKIPSYGVSELNDPKAKGKKFKTYIKQLSEIEDKQNSIVDKGVKLVNDIKPLDSFDKLKMSSGKAMIEGGNMKLKEIADKKRTTASIQDAILQTADELGLKSDDLAKGKIRKAKKGAKIKGSAEEGDKLFSEKDLQEGMTPIQLDNPERPQFAFDPVTGASDPSLLPLPPGPRASDKEKFDWMTIVNSVLPHLRPSNQTPLDPGQLSGEMFALSTNQLEPVQAQKFQPLLESQSDISLQDQLNANQSDFNALKRAVGGNPALLAGLAGQKYAANSKVLGEQFRINQSQKLNTANKNRATLNDASLKNLAILDQQYTRQSQAKSNTKATAQAALSSIADKIAKNKLENRTLGIYENLYNYRFGPRGNAFNMNPLADFNIPEAGSLIQSTEDGNAPKLTEREWEIIRRDKLGMPTGKTEGRSTTKKQRNGGIVKAIKNL